MPTMLPETALPKERYPVMATRIYIKPAEPILVMTTPAVRKWELLAISLRIENIFKSTCQTRLSHKLVAETYILVTCISENDDRKAAQRLNGASPFEPSYFTSFLHRVSFCKMINDEDH